MTTDVDPYAVALAVTGALDALGVEHTVGGSIALKLRAPVTGDAREHFLDDRLVAGRGAQRTNGLRQVYCPPV